MTRARVLNWALYFLRGRHDPDLPVRNRRTVGQCFLDALEIVEYEDTPRPPAVFIITLPDGRKESIVFATATGEAIKP